MPVTFAPGIFRKGMSEEEGIAALIHCIFDSVRQRFPQAKASQIRELFMGQIARSFNAARQGQMFTEPLIGGLTIGTVHGSDDLFAVVMYFTETRQDPVAEERWCAIAGRLFDQIASQESQT